MLNKFLIRATMFHASSHVESIMVGDVKIQGHSLGGMVPVLQFKNDFSLNNFNDVMHSPQVS